LGGSRHVTGPGLTRAGVPGSPFSRDARAALGYLRWPASHP